MTSAFRNTLSTTSILSIGVVAIAATPTHAAIEQIRITVQNLAPANSVAVTPLRFGFGNGSFDSFNQGSSAFLFGQSGIATAPIVTIAEGGSGSTWLPTFMAAEPTANVNSLAGPTGGAFVPGATNSAVFNIDTSNPYFTFASMVVPSNDRFLGNDDPKKFRVLDDSGNLILPSITQFGSDIWDAGSEQDIPANAAFLAIGTNDLRLDQNGVVAFNNDFSVYNGLLTAAGYTFNSGLLPGTAPLERISFAVVPEPTSLGTLAIGAVVLVRRRRA